MNIAQLYNIYLNHPQIISDSRKIITGCIFWAIKGANFDGNKFAKSALKQGAAYAVCDNPEIKHPQIIQVTDTLKTIQELAKYHIKKLNIPTVAITGTNGKTTTKELTAACLAQKYTVGYTQGNFNNHLGVPLTILNFNANTDIAIIEMGANHEHEINDLCQIADPDFGLITNVGKAHIEGFGNEDTILRTKTELYKYLQNKNAEIFLNIDAPKLVQKAKQLKRTTYSLKNNNADIFGEIKSALPFLNMTVKFKKTNSEIQINSKLIGIYNAENILAAASVALKFGLSPEEIKYATEQYIPQNNRSQYTETQNNKLILDAYNANPTSMKLALQTLHTADAEFKTAIIGDMLELGEISKQEHQKILDFAESLTINQIITVGTEFGKLSKSNLHFENTEKLSTYLKQYPPSDSLILLKASRGIGLEKIVKYL